MHKLKLFKKLIFLTEGDKKFCHFSKNKWKSSRKSNYDGIVLVDFVTFEHYIYQSSYSTNYFKNNNNLDIRYFQFIPRNKYILRTFFQFFRNFSRLHKLYKSFGCNFGLINVFDKNTIRIAKSLKFSSKEELVNFSLEGIQIGDLIYDTYLRENSTPTVDLDDERLFWIVDNAISIFYSTKNYLKKYNVKKILTSHGVYVNYGIIVRLAVHSDIDVYQIGYHQAMHKFNKNKLSMPRQHDNYPNEFNTLNDKEIRRKKARKMIELRFSENMRNEEAIQPAYQDFFATTMAHLKESRNEKQLFLNNGKTKVVIFLHCFFDSPHIYKSMIFPDFFEWIEFVLNTLDLPNLDLVIKPHPNGKPGNGKVIDRLKNKFPNARFIDKFTPNDKLVSENVEFLLTVYGTSAHEFGYRGVKAITAGDNPASAYDFCFHAKSKDEYRHYLQNIGKLPKNINKEKIEEFFYMHYLHPSHGRLEENKKILDINWDIPSGHPDIFIDFIEEHNKGLHDEIFDNISAALEQLE